jgi:hypothetical protein
MVHHVPPTKLAAVDATDASFIAGELTAVGTPLQVYGTIPESKRGRFPPQLKKRSSPTSRFTDVCHERSGQR